MIKNLIELMIKGTSGWSSARVEVETAVSIADDSVEKAERWTKVREVPLTSTGTKERATLDAAATKIMDNIQPKID